MLKLFIFYRTIVIFFILLLLSNISNAQENELFTMENIDYKHDKTMSLEAKIIQNTLSIFNMKKKMEKSILNNTYPKIPAKLPNSLSKNYNINEIVQNGRTTWIISPYKSESDAIILYFHGGAYYSNLSKAHWILIEQLLIKTQATIVVPDYPLAPESNYLETYSFVEKIYTYLLINYSNKRIIFMGDSAGAGLGLGLALELKNEHKILPQQIILFSPWLDISMSNKEIEEYNKKDKILSIKGLTFAGQKYAANLDLTNYRLSPLYGDFEGMCQISIFVGTNDILFADAQKFKQIMKNNNANFNYFEYPKMFHDWVIISSLKESQDVLTRVSELIKAQ